jgi:hypothetical protein
MCIGMANGGKTPKMTPQEAMKLVEECGLNIEGIANIECESVIFYALEKQIPKKPIENGIGGYICPHCQGVILDLPHELYHRDCGGRLE